MKILFGLLFILLSIFPSFSNCGIVIKSYSISANCYGGNGKILLTKVEGGTRPYTFHWSDGSTQQNLIAKSGIYTVTVLDAFGCSATITDTITQPTKLVLTTTFTPIVCGDGTSTITNHITGGVAPYTSQFFNKTNQPIPSGNNVVGGLYRTRITDKQGCTMETVGFFNIVDTIPPLSITNTITLPTSKTSANGSINIIVAGGNIPYTFKWSNGKTTQNIKNIKTGTYSVIITDKNLCSSIFSIFVDYKKSPITKMSTIEDDESVLKQNYPNPPLDKTTIRYDVEEKTTSNIEVISLITNKTVYSTQIDPGEDFIELDVSHLSPGIYIYRLVTDGAIISTKQMIIK